MVEPLSKPPNPFVGPRAIQEDEPFFGREKELEDLVDQLYAERVVLMYSPSGAGKSSLINAGLIPELKDSFRILPVLRLNRAFPESLAQIERVDPSTMSPLAVKSTNCTRTFLLDLLTTALGTPLLIRAALCL